MCPAFVLISNVQSSFGVSIALHRHRPVGPDDVQAHGRVCGPLRAAGLEDDTAAQRRWFHGDDLDVLDVGIGDGDIGGGHDLRRRRAARRALL
jgi:hypothetical protein